MIEARFLLQSENAYCFQKAQRPQPVSVGRVFGCFKADRDMALGCEVVDFVRLDLLDDANKVGGVREITVVQDEVTFSDVRILIQVIDAIGIERRRAALDAVDDVALAEQKVCEIGPILTGDTGN